MTASHEWITVLQAEEESALTGSQIYVWISEDNIDHVRNMENGVSVLGARRGQHLVRRDQLPIKKKKAKAIKAVKVKKGPRRPSQMEVLATCSQKIVDFFGSASGNGASADEFREWRKSEGVLQHRYTGRVLVTEEDWFKLIQDEIRDGVKKITKQEARF